MTESKEKKSDTKLNVMKKKVSYPECRACANENFYYCWQTTKEEERGKAC